MFATVLLLAAATAAPGGARQPSSPSVVAPSNLALTFTYQQNVEPWPSGACVHKPAADDPFGLDVLCEIDGQRRLYAVHLALSFYPRTTHGGSGYELLYWVTDRSVPGSPRFTSVTQWTHLATPDDRAKVIEAFLGVEDDLASLRLEIRL
jgi:hypothetical protein